MHPKKIIDLQNLCKVIVGLKKQLVEELPHYGNESLFFHNNEITTDLMNNKTEIKINLLPKKFLYFNNEKGYFVNLNDTDLLTKLEKIAKNLILTFLTLELIQ